VRIRFPSGQGVANLSAVAANQVLQVASSGPPPDPPSLSVADASVLEGNSGKIGMNFTVSLSQAPAAGTSVSVKVATANGTAKAHNDYFALPSTTLVFGPGETVKVVTVFVKGETIHESNETFLFELSSPVGATLADSEAIATIINDD
jgi:chitinase